MEKSTEEIIDELYHEVGQMFFAGLSEDDVFKILYERNLTEKVASFIIKEAKNNIVKISSNFQGLSDKQEKLEQIIEQINQSKDYPIVDLGELEKFSSKEELMSLIEIPCIVFFDADRVLTDDVAGENKDIHKRKYAWKRKYEIEGSNLEHKAGMMQILSKQEYDGYDYIEITMTDAEDNLVGKSVFLNGDTYLIKVSPQGKVLGDIEGHVNDD
jgi:hypothetical protein